MKRIRFICLLSLLCLVNSMTYSQSMSWVNYYMEQGDYLNAAKELRPLADGGNAEAQLLAAKLFFEGKGVMQSDAQGVNYATMAADQGNVEGIELLLNHLYKIENPDTYATAKKYADKFPDIKKGVVGVIMAKCLLEGACKTQVDEDLGWKIMEGNDSFQESLDDLEFADKYWSYKVKSNNKASADDLAEYYYQADLREELSRLQSYLLKKYSTTSAVEERANNGSAWAMNQLALYYYDRNNKDAAMEWARKAAEAGSKRGNDIIDKINYIPVACKDIKFSSQKSSRYNIESIVLEYDRMTLNCVFKNDGFISWIAIATDMSLRYNGKIYKMISTTLPVLPNRKTVSFSEVVHYSVTFERIPINASRFDVMEQGEVIYSNVQILDFPENGGVIKPVVTLQPDFESAENMVSGASDDIKDKAYYYTSERKHLKNMGIINKKDEYLAQSEDVVKKYGNTIDKSSEAKIQLWGKKYKLLTKHPAGSYKTEQRSYKKYLNFVIVDPEKFWSESDVAVILYE